MNRTRQELGPASSSPSTPAQPNTRFPSSSSGHSTGTAASGHNTEVQEAACGTILGISGPSKNSTSSSQSTNGRRTRNGGREKDKYRPGGG